MTRVSKGRGTWSLGIATMFGAWMALGDTGVANAGISGVSTSSSTCTNPRADDEGFVGCSVATSINNGTTLGTRYRLNVNADTGVGSTRDASSAATHAISFSATAPGGYRLDVSTSRVGDLNRVSDVLNCDGSADISGVAGTSSVPPASGTLDLADPGSLPLGTTTLSLPFNQSSGVAKIFGVSDGAAQPHTLTFTFSAAVRSASCEVAVRLGENGSTGGCSGCEYPGSPARTQSNDGHFVTVTFVSLCGNSSIDAEVGEACDDGNETSGDGCSSTCQIESGPTTTTSTTESTTTSTSSSSTSSTSTSTSATPPLTTSSTTLPTSGTPIPGRITLIKNATIAKFVAKPAPPGGTFPLPTADPVAEGGTLRFFDHALVAGDNTYLLASGSTPPLGWKGLGDPPGSKGYKYTGAGIATDPCKIVLIKEKVIKGLCKGSDVTLAPPFTGDVGIVLTLGASDRYCASFGGDEVKNDATLTKRKNASAPGECPSVSVCGDGIVQTGEECDDGNVVALDGCSATCQFEPGDVAGNCSPDSGTAEIVSVGTSQNVLLRGCIVTPSDSFNGELLVVGDALACVAADCSAAPGTATATVVDTHGIVLPGLVDTHNHILFDIFDETDWTPAQTYTNHNQWPNEVRYQAMIAAKEHLNGESGSPVDVGCEMYKYGELKGLVAGTTSIVGAATPANKLCYGSLARTIDQSPNDLAADKVQTATLFPTTATADAVCVNYANDSTDAYLVHCGEGTDATALTEFQTLQTVSATDGCLYAPETAIVHGIAFGSAEFETMAAHGMGLIWSPREQVFLYSGGTDLTKTTNVPLARSKGINVAISPDWSIGGSQNMLDELRFANMVDDSIWGDVLTSKDLVSMATENAARVLGLSAMLGSLSVGKKADLFVIGGNRAYPWDAVLTARPSDVRLVMVNGIALYGDDELEAIGAASPGCEALDVCGTLKFACVAESGGTATNKLGQTFTEISTAISTELANYDALNVSAWDFAPVTPIVRCP